MAKILYSLSGEGQGHATRALVMTKALVAEGHEITLYSSGDGYALLQQVFPDKLRRIPGFRFEYFQGKISYRRSILNWISLLPKIYKKVQNLRKELRKDFPDLGIVDFDPVLPIALELEKIPYVTLDHPSIMAFGDFQDLPLEIRAYQKIYSPFIRSMCRNPQERIITSFFSPALSDSVSFTGPILRKKILSGNTSDDSFVLAYLRESVSPLIPFLEECGMPVKVYGLPKKADTSNIKFLESHPTEFIRDLKSCRAVVCTAGNQIISESLFLKKPILAVPDPSQYEQIVNGWYLNQIGGGLALRLSQINQSTISWFVNRPPPPIENPLPCGNRLAIQKILNHLK